MIDTVFLIRLIVGLYIAAALTALFFFRREKYANIIPNAICILASVTGITAALAFLLGHSDRLVIFKFDVPAPFVSIQMQLDSLSAIFLLTLSILVLCVSIYSIGYLTHYYQKRNVGLFNFLYSTFILSMLFVFTAGNMVFFFIVWEIMSLTSYFLVVFESDHKENQKAGTIYIVMMHVGAAVLLMAFMLLYSYTGSFDIFANHGALPGLVKNIVFVLLLIGFGTKAGIIPLHIWLPYAHPAAASNVSALMSGIMIKTAIYGLIRFVAGYLGIHSLWWGIAILVLGMVSTVLGVAYALMEHNIKRLLAYHSIENIGIILIGLGVSFIAFAQGNMVLFSLALMASLFHTFNHAVFKGGLFLGAGSIQYSTHTKNIEELGGLIKVMPYTSIFMLFFSLAICAIVPFNGFASEWMTYQSLFMNIQPGYSGLNVVTIFSAAALAIAGALALACFVKLYGISFLGLPRSEKSKTAKEVPIVMRAGMAVLAGICLVIGLFPFLITRLLDGVSSGIGGTSIFDSLKGKLSFVYYPMKISDSSIMPVGAVILIAAAVIMILVFARFIGGKLKTRKYNTWDCGYEALNSRMQYSATGFSKPIRIVFRILYRPGRVLKVEEGASPYYPVSMKYDVSTQKVFEKYMYYPLAGFFKRFSRRLKFIIQTGSVHTYLLYIFLAILALMFYNSITK